MKIFFGGGDEKMFSTDYRVGGKITPQGKVVFYVRHAGKIIATGFKSRRAAQLYAVRHFKRHAPKSMRRVRRRVRRVHHRKHRVHKRHHKRRHHKRRHHKRKYR
jgi:hypothetical protein